MTMTNRNQVTVTPTAKLAVSVSGAAPKYTDAEIYQFWNEHVDRLVMKELIAGKYSIPAVNRRYQFLLQGILDKYGKAFRLEPSTMYNEYSSMVVAGWDDSVDPPAVRIFVPALMNVRRSLGMSGSPLWERQFETTIVMGVMHELEHGAGDPPHSKALTRQELITAEAKAWDQTSRYTISEFVRHQYPLGFNDTYYHNGWIRCGKENNDCLRTFIGNTYSDITRHYQ